MATQPTAESGGLPQFDFSWWGGEIVWMLVIFGILYLLFARVFVPRVGGAIAAREDKTFHQVLGFGKISPWLAIVVLAVIATYIIGIPLRKAGSPDEPAPPPIVM